jgi:hypothetical protein
MQKQSFTWTPKLLISFSFAYRSKYKVINDICDYDNNLESLKIIYDFEKKLNIQNNNSLIF